MRALRLESPALAAAVKVGVLLAGDSRPGRRVAIQLALLAAPACPCKAAAAARRGAPVGCLSVSRVDPRLAPSRWTRRRWPPAPLSMTARAPRARPHPPPSQAVAPRLTAWRAARAAAGDVGVLLSLSKQEVLALPSKQLAQLQVRDAARALSRRRR